MEPLLIGSKELEFPPGSITPNDVVKLPCLRWIPSSDLFDKFHGLGVRDLAFRQRGVLVNETPDHPVRLDGLIAGKNKEVAQCNS